MTVRYDKLWAVMKDNKMKKRVIHIRKGEIIRDDKKGGYDYEI